MEIVSPIIVIPSYGSTDSKCIDVLTKGLVSSLLRSLFSGQISVIRDKCVPLFRVERAALAEVSLSDCVPGGSSFGSRHFANDLLAIISKSVNLEPRRWVTVALLGSLALRNVDHLIRPDLPGPYAPEEVDFYWARAGKDVISNQTATPGLWAVRREYLPLVLERWKDAWSKELGAESANEEEIWTRVVQELPLRKRTFEKGEVVAPRIGAVDWEAVSNAAFVTVPDWPEKEAWKFLQALYFGTYLGDETGLMLNILEA